MEIGAPFGPDSVFAVNCRKREWHQTGGGPEDGYWRNLDSDIWLNADNIVFGWGTSQAGSEPSARGILTHEIGHAAFLYDLYPAGCGSPLNTMCGAISDNESWLLESITTDDVNSANLMYQ